MRIAMLGCRGVPATFGGVERHVEELGARLVERGHDVTVYCRSNYVADRMDWHRGMRLRHLPTIPTKHLDAAVHTALATGRVMLHRYDVVHYHAIGPGLLAPLPRYLTATSVVQTIHGLDAGRAKWGPLARRVLGLGEWMSARVPDATITVSRTLGDHYRSVHGREPFSIPNGVVERTRRPPAAALRRHGLEPRGYVLFVGRLVPEKRVDLLIAAFRQLRADVRLVIVGGSSFTDRHVDELHRLAASDPRICFTGWAYGDELDELYSSAACFVSPSALEAGPPLTMLEAISVGIPVVVSDIPTQMEAIGADGHGHRAFVNGDEAALLSALRRALADPDAEHAGAAVLRNEVLSTYTWEQCAELVERVYVHVTRPRAPRITAA